MKRPHTDDGLIEPGDLVMWIGDDGEPRTRTAAGPDDVISGTADLVSALYAESNDGATRAIQDAVDVEVFDVTLSSNSLSFAVGAVLGNRFEMTYPFTVGQFWAELEAVEQSAIANLKPERDPSA